MKQLSSRVIYTNPWLTLREDQVERVDGSQGVYSVVDASDFAIVLPYENGGFHLVEQYRYPLGARTWEFPSGSFPAGVTGTPEQLAVSELREETGLTAARWRHLGLVHPANSMIDQTCHAFLATDLTPGAPNREATEVDMRQEWFPRTDVLRMVTEGKITDGPSLAAYLLLSLHSFE
jgi:8-oxo-dGTP pyrophosphatase MutT (NUDIX family)